MKKLILLICMLAGMSSCYHEDALIVPEQPDKYNILTDDPSDPTQHFIYQFYQKYQTVIITNPTEADYKFNFTANNGIKITAPEQKQEIIDEGIEFLQKVLLNLYSDSFLKKNLPFSILLSEEVRMASYGETTIMNCYASSSFIALGNVSSSLKTMTDEEFVKNRADVNASFWAKYISEVRGLFSISDADFYSQRVSQNILKDIENHTLILKENRHNEVDMWVSYMAFVFDLNFKSSYLFIRENDYIHRNMERLHFTGNLKEDMLYARNIPIDINPIRKEKSGTLSEYMQRAEYYLDEMEIKNFAIEVDSLARSYDNLYVYKTMSQEEAADAITEDILHKKSDYIKDFLKATEKSETESDVKKGKDMFIQMEKLERLSIFEREPETIPEVDFYVAECSEFPTLGEYYDGLTLAEAIAIYEKIPGERLNGVKGIGIDLHFPDDDMYSGKCDLLAGGRICREMLDAVPRYKENREVRKAVKYLENHFNKKEELSLSKPKKQEQAPRL